jgi:hypothetical protein
MFALDHYNDELNNGRQLEDTSNLYRTTPGVPTISAMIECSRAELASALEKADKLAHPIVAKWRKRRDLPLQLTLTCNIKTRRYAISEKPFTGTDVEHTLAEAIFAQLPYILYFDDFRDKVDERIEIPAGGVTDISGWVAIVQQLFRQTDPELSIFQLYLLEERQRKNV